MCYVRKCKGKHKIYWKSSFIAEMILCTIVYRNVTFNTTLKHSEFANMTKYFQENVITGILLSSFNVIIFHLKYIECILGDIRKNQWQTLC